MRKISAEEMHSCVVPPESAYPEASWVFFRSCGERAIAFNKSQIITSALSNKKIQPLAVDVELFLVP